MDKLTRKYKGLFAPLAIAMVLIVSIFLAGNFLFNGIATVRSEAEELRGKVNTLQSRLATLQAAEKSVRNSVGVASFAIPEKNPSILVTKQLRNLATERGVTISDFSVAAATSLEGEAVSSYTINFTASAPDYDTLANYISELSRLLPLVNLGSLTMKGGVVSGVEAQISLLAYSASYPETLPSLEDPLSGLALGEEEVLKTLGEFSSPAVSSPLAPSEVTPRVNPFSLEI